MPNRQFIRIVIALLYVVSGALWIHWLRTLEKEPDQTKKCSEVQPTLRLALHILAWFGIASTIGGSTWLLYNIFKFIPKDVFIMIAGPTILVAILAIALFTTQIVYIRSVASSERRVADQCTEIETVKHTALIIVSALIIAVGLFKLFSAFLTDDAQQQLRPDKVAFRKKLAEMMAKTKKKSGGARRGGHRV